MSIRGGRYLEVARLSLSRKGEGEEEAADARLEPLLRQDTFSTLRSICKLRPAGAKKVRSWERLVVGGRMMGCLAPWTSVRVTLAPTLILPQNQRTTWWWARTRAGCRCWSSCATAMVAIPPPPPLPPTTVCGAQRGCRWGRWAAGARCRGSTWRRTHGAGPSSQVCMYADTRHDPLPLLRGRVVSSPHSYQRSFGGRAQGGGGSAARRGDGPAGAAPCPRVREGLGCVHQKWKEDAACGPA